MTTQPWPRKPSSTPSRLSALDVGLLRSSTILPATITVSGHVYDVNTGLITTVAAGCAHVTAAAIHRRSPHEHPSPLPSAREDS